MGRVACLDYGLKRIGVAISDENRIIASSAGTVEAHKNPAETIKRILKALEEYTPDEIVVGYPLHMNGKVGLLADEVQHFITALQKETPYPVKLWDERLSSVQADRALRESGMSRKKRSKLVDTVSAALILQSYLDSQSPIFH